MMSEISGEVDGIVYPKDALAILKNKTLWKALFDHCAAEFSTENVEFLEVSAKPDPQKQYPIYIEAGSEKEINIDHTLRRKAAALADDQDWDNPKWILIYQECRNEINDLITSDTLTRFYKRNNRFFYKIHSQLVSRKYGGDPMKVSDKLGISYEEALELLQKRLAERKIKAAEAQNMTVEEAENAAREKIQDQREREDSVRQANERRRAETVKQVLDTGTDISPLKLELCGFKKPRNETVRKNIMELCNAVNDGDKSQATINLKRLLKAEPSLPDKKLPDLIKTLRKYKVLNTK